MECQTEEEDPAALEAWEVASALETEVVLVVDSLCDQK
jgi:hypothetical protein